MKNKFIFGFIIVLTLFLSISAISANDNMTDVVSQDDLDDSIDDVNKSESEIQAKDKVSYTDLSDTFEVTLKSNNTALANKSVQINLNHVSYNKTTDANGKARIDFKLKAGSYIVSFYFNGDDNYTSCNGTAKIVVKPDIVTYLDVVDKDINYREGLKSIFQLKLVDVNGKAVSGKHVLINVDGKTYEIKTDSKGYATTYLNLKKGVYTITYSFSNEGAFLSSSGSFDIEVKSKMDKGNGYWVNKWSMKKVNLKKLSKRGTKQIFLQHTAFAKYGEAKVLKWIKKAHKYGIKVHIWITVFYKNGKYIHASNKKGVYNYNQMNKIIGQVKHYASLDGVDGVHFDYVRFGGNAYKYKNAVEAVNYFVKNASLSLREVNPDIIVSVAVMPEPSSMKYYYAQDIPTMSKYVDAILPMIYKGNYHATAKWIKKTTKKFIKQSNGAQIWAGLQTYKSDSNIKKLSYKTLLKDAKAAKKGGAHGIVLFRYGLTKFLNFKKV